MEKIHLVMPMGGGGTRFGNKGFNLPKPLIELSGRPFFYWAVNSVIKFNEVYDIIFVVLQEHVDRFSIDKRILELYPSAKIQVIPKVLAGAVLTCNEGLKLIDDDRPILFNDCDHAFICSAFKEFCESDRTADTDGGLMTYISDSPAYSYVRFDEAGRVIGTVEKKVVSNEAICGAYYFKNASTFTDAMETYLDNCSYSEYFVSGVYNELIKKGGNIATFRVDENISFGTPDEYDAAIEDPRLKRLIL